VKDIGVIVLQSLGTVVSPNCILTLESAVALVLTS